MSLMRNSALGVYISIPFCRSKCTYCNFASGVYPAADHARYVDRLIEDMAGAGNWAEEMGACVPRLVDTVYLGGGTPSLLSPELIDRLFAALHTYFDVQQGAEVTVECAPGQISPQVLEALAASGVNRVSLGVQSFIDREAHVSGRLHSRAVVLDDLRRLRSAGIANLNLDLIAGLAGQTLSSWNESLTILLDCAVPHASIYMLEVDDESRLGREMLSGGARYYAGLVPADEAIALMYETAIDRLEKAGLRQYEISNFAKPGVESCHNLRYWQRRPYLGLGLDASSMLFARGNDAVLRSTTTAELKAYLDRSEPAETAWLSPERQHEEAWFLGLRLNDGVDSAVLEEEFGRAAIAPALETAQRLAGDGLLEIASRRVRLTPRGRLISNDVFAEFLATASAT